MSGFAQLIFLFLMLLGLLFLWTAGGFIYSIMKLSREETDENSRCKICEYLCQYSGSLTFQEQIIMFPNLVIAFVACKIIKCDC